MIYDEEEIKLEVLKSSKEISNNIDSNNGSTGYSGSKES